MSVIERGEVPICNTSHQVPLCLPAIGKCASEKTATSRGLLTTTSSLPAATYVTVAPDPIQRDRSAYRLRILAAGKTGIIHKERAELFRFIFRQFAAKRPADVFARHLSARSVPKPSGIEAAIVRSFGNDR
ncbi:hypothetical protein [Beijerinckia sp. L45]|uniref:hypothetical protein n=1 Tax=Beijerinckia sp. L45 TaxID=1641855 RepID=UPI00131C4095